MKTIFHELTTTFRSFRLNAIMRYVRYGRVKSINPMDTAQCRINHN